MHYSTTTIITIGALCTTIGAAPAPSPGHPFPAAVQKLDADGKVTWTSTASGGRTAQIPFDDIASVETDIKIKQRGILSGVGSWTNLGRIANDAAKNFAAEYACQDSGSYATSSVVSSTAETACRELVKMVPGQHAASTAWNVWQGAKEVGSSEANAAFRFFYKTKEAPKLDEVMCKKALSILTESACQGKGNNNDKSLGGEIRIGEGDDYVQIGFDPTDV